MIPTPLGWRQQLGALGSLLGIAWLIFMGDPVFKRAERDVYDKPGAYAEAVERYGTVGAGFAWFGGMVRTELRQPVLDWLNWTTIPLRNSQGFGVYPDGGRSIKVLDVYLDGKLRHRSRDPEHDWLEPQLRFRKIRPLVFKWMGGKLKSKHRPGITRFLAVRAQEQGAERVDLVVWQGPYPGTDLSLKNWAIIEAPGWKLEVQDEDAPAPWEAP